MGGTFEGEVALRLGSSSPCLPCHSGAWLRPPHDFCPAARPRRAVPFRSARDLATQMSELSLASLGSGWRRPRGPRHAPVWLPSVPFVTRPRDLRHVTPESPPQSAKWPGREAGMTQRAGADERM